jgi:predicted TIM-barrel fold metal-dependent hydrolase
MTDYQHTFPSTVYAPLLTHVHTSHATSPLPLLHLYLSSVFDRHPGLRLILAHPGVLPSLIPRIEMLLTTIPAADKPKRSFLDVWQHNIYLTTADAQDMSSLRALLEQIPVDRVLYVSNYPFEERGKELMDELRDSGFLTQVEWERVAWGNAEIVFDLKGANTKGGRRWNTSEG